MTLHWVPWNFSQHRDGSPYGWLPLGWGRYLSWGLGADRHERISWSCGPLAVTRPETEEERLEREEGEAEDALMEYEHNRYTEWSY